jgi:hypothetical protein
VDIVGGEFLAYSLIVQVLQKKESLRVVASILKISIESRQCYRDVGAYMQDPLPKQLEEYD